METISQDTIVQAAQGNLESFEVIYRAFSGFVFNVVFRVVNHMDDAEEVTQDVFLTIYRKLDRFGFKSSLKTWIYRIAVNSAINHAKKRSRERFNRVEFDDNMELTPAGDAVQDRMDRKDQEKIVSSLLAALNPDQRACLVLRDFEGLSYEEVAETLKININTVRSRLKRAREKLLGLSKEVVRHDM